LELLLNIITKKFWRNLVPLRYSHFPTYFYPEKHNCHYKFENLYTLGKISYKHRKHTLWQAWIWLRGAGRPYRDDNVPYIEWSMILLPIHQRWRECRQAHGRGCSWAEIPLQLLPAVWCGQALLNQGNITQIFGWQGEVSEDAQLGLSLAQKRQFHDHLISRDFSFFLKITLKVLPYFLTTPLSHDWRFLFN
jgi:hypothetical protein